MAFLRVLSTNCWVSGDAKKNRTRIFRNLIESLILLTRDWICFLIIHLIGGL